MIVSASPAVGRRVRRRTRLHADGPVERATDTVEWPRPIEAGGAALQPTPHAEHQSNEAGHGKGDGDDDDEFQVGRNSESARVASCDRASSGC